MEYSLTLGEKNYVLRPDGLIRRLKLKLLNAMQDNFMTSEK